MSTCKRILYRCPPTSRPRRRRSTPYNLGIILPTKISKNVRVPWDRHLDLVTGNWLTPISLRSENPVKEHIYIMPEGPERGQSPPPERSTGKQMHDAPASGKGTDDASHKQDINKEALEVGGARILRWPSAQG